MEFVSESIGNRKVGSSNLPEPILCKPTIDMAIDLADIDSRIKLEIYDIKSEEAKRYKVDRVPTIFIGPKRGYNIKYTGSPIGQEAWAY